MYYVVIDLEWNQYHNPMWTPTSRMGVVMHEEIIQIGAIKLDKQLNPVDTFNLYVRLGGRRRLDRYVKKLTGISESDLLSGEDFASASEMFGAWLQDVDAVFSWGQDDMRVYLNNLAFYGLDAPSCAWFDAQRIYALQNPDHGGLALKNIAQEQNVRVNLTLHDAMNDAILTAFCMRALDIDKGIAEYAVPRKAADDGTVAPLLTRKTHRHPTKQEAWDEAGASLMRCPDCMQPLEWKGEEQGSIDRWYKTASCAQHGDYVIRGEFQGVKAYTLKLSFFKSSDEVTAMIEKELTPKTKKRRRRGGRGAKKKQQQPVPQTAAEDLLTRAIAFAADAHKEQTLLPGTSPYIVHPMEVTAILSTLTDDPALLAAGMLHDTLSMCGDVTSEKLESEFGAHVCELVEGEAARMSDAVGELTQEEQKLLLSDALSGLRGIARSNETDGKAFWASLGKTAKREMAALYKRVETATASLENTGAYGEFVKTYKTVFGRIKV